MRWNEAALEVVGGSNELAEVCDELAVLEGWVGGPLPDAVHEWYLLDGDRRLASISSNLVTRTRDFASRKVGRFLDHGFLPLGTDSQHCCRWVVAVSAADGDPPVYLIDPDDDLCATRSRYAGTFSDYAFAAVWDATLWAGEPSAGFDHPLPSDAIDALEGWLTALPTTKGWAMNQKCDAVYRFGGAADVAVAVAVAVMGSTAVWSAIAAPSAVTRDAVAKVIGAP